MSLGFDAGNNLVPGNLHNREGYFEDRHVVETHRKLLSELDGRDLAVTPLPADWATRSQTYAAKTSLTEYLQTKFANSADVVIKDPRISLLLPMWYDIGAALGADLKLVFCTRSPAAVAESLAASGRTPHAVGESIWLCRVMAAAENWRGGFVAAFDDMIADPAAVFGTLADWLGCKIDEAQVAGLIKGDLKHHASNLPVANGFAAHVFGALRKANASELLDGQNALLARYHASLELFAGMVERLRAVEAAKQMESIDVAYRLIDDVARERAEKVIAEERNEFQTRIAMLQQDHAGEIALEREERKGWEARIALLAEEHSREIAQEREHLVRLTEINRLQELDIRKVSQQLGAIKAWRSANETQRQQLTQLIAKLNQTRASLGQFGQWGDAAVVPAQWLREMLERVRSAAVTEVDRANPVALLLWGVRAIKRRRSIFRRRLLHIHYLIALRSRIRSRDAIAIATSGYFDPHYYRAANGHDPLVDFMNTSKGARDPSLLFSSKFYSDTNPTVESANVNPLVHFIRKGKANGAKASPIESFGVAIGSLLGKVKPAAKRARLQRPQVETDASSQTTAPLPGQDDPGDLATLEPADQEIASELKQDEADQSPSIVAE